MADDVLSTPETRKEAASAVEEAYATLSRVQSRWPEIRDLKSLRFREREENHFGPKTKRMFGA